jgi:1-acyl-sn-glycerol-3-phosphate acyltransferase
MRFSYRLTAFVLRLLFRAAYKLEVSAPPSLPEGPVLIAANHQSNLDPPLIGAFHPREMHFVAKKQLFEQPLLARVIRHFNAIPIDRAGVDRTALKEIRGLLDDGEDLVVFPEGTRSKTGELGRPRHGLGMILAMAQVDVLPILIDGTRHRPGFLLGRPRLKLRFGPLIRWQELEAQLADCPRSERAERLTQQVFSELIALKSA